MLRAFPALQRRKLPISRLCAGTVAVGLCMHVQRMYGRLRRTVIRADSVELKPAGARTELARSAYPRGRYSNAAAALCVA